jgi:hypothetical protein
MGTAVPYPPKIDTTIIHPNGHKLTTATVPTNVPIQLLVRALAARMDLPTTSPRGRPVIYRLSLMNNTNTDERELSPDSTLAEQEVPTKSRLRLYSEMQAG